jgi:Mn2+/Fe2+ NRAMP family transporter
MTESTTDTTRPGLFATIGPGILLAATGVGAGDLATGAFTGSRLGTTVLWAVLVGAFLKFVLTEGLARWQLATGQTLLEGAATRFGRPVGWIFLPYLMLWSFFVGSALMSACGVTLHAMLPVFERASTAKVVFGIMSSIAGLALVRIGGYRLFERVMSVCIGFMFATVLVTAALVWPGTAEVVRGLVAPTIPDAAGVGVTWTIALIGGVGGTLTILCYGYWIREQGRNSIDDLALCRLDLGVGYVMTALFGVAMVIIGSTLRIHGGGAGLLVELADVLYERLGSTGRWVFLIGAFGAVFSSLLGVWQAVPYLFADVWRLFVRSDQSDATVVITQSMPYRAYLTGIAIVPMLGLLVSFREVQKLYAVIGATFIPLLAVALLIMNGRRAWVGDLVNRRSTIGVLLAALVLFGGMMWLKWSG